MSRSSTSTVNIAAEREAEGGTDFPHPQALQFRHAPTQSVLRNGDRIVHVDGAGRFHAILFTQDDFGGNSTDSRRNGCDTHGSQIRDGAVAR